MMDGRLALALDLVFLRGRIEGLPGRKVDRKLFLPDVPLGRDLSRLVLNRTQEGSEVMEQSPNRRRAALATPASAAPEVTQIFRRQGEYWTIVYAGTTVRLRNAIGLEYLAHLLARPHQRIRVEELLAAVKGITAGDVERARSAVGKRLRAAVRRVQEHHPALGYHLRAGITTGMHCGYVPDPQRPLRWMT
jgi:hypothetical protein